MLPDLNEISASQAKPTLHTKIDTDVLLNYAHTYPNAKICYPVINMILHVESDIACLVMPGCSSCIYGS